MNNKNVLIAMSGGIDSSVAAMLLQEQGYNLFGVTFRSWDYITQGCLEKHTGCCSVESIYEAKELADKLGFSHQILDARDIFKKTVIKNFIDEYMSGRTPNPCVVCNTYIKWGIIQDFADKLNCKYIATGHYAKIKYENNRYFLAQGKDAQKDQSYFLWNLTQENLARTLFPLGDLTKNEVRKIALKLGFKEISQKRESQEICFVPDNNYRNFLKENVADIDKNIKQGNFISTDGKILGKHKGLAFYTVGQRKGLEIAVGYPLYVVKIDALTNTITLGKKEDLLNNEMFVCGCVVSKYLDFEKGMKLNVKIRYRSEPVGCTIDGIVEDKVKIIMDKPVEAITPGQSAVFYQNDDVVGGGIICD